MTRAMHSKSLAAQSGHLFLLAALMLAGCARNDRALVEQASAGAAASAPSPSVNAGRRADQALAYEHVVSIELAKEALPERMSEVQSACAAHKEFSCTLLNVSFQRERIVPSGTIRLRMAPAAVNPMIQMAARGGDVNSRSTHAEDLAEPVADVDRQLSMLTTRREQLEQFTKRKDLKVDELITLSKELAAVQTQIDGLNSQRANLRRRIDTELLTLNFSISPEASAAAETPVLNALRSSGTDFKNAVAHVISFLSALLPWLVIFVPGLVLLRLLWRWTTRLIAPREPRP